jgi:hypothetical protein
MVPPELLELTPCLYARISSNASEELLNTRFPQGAHILEILNLAYLMNSVSRSWSLLTNDFIVR